MRHDSYSVVDADGRYGTAITAESLGQHWRLQRGEDVSHPLLVDHLVRRASQVSFDTDGQRCLHPDGDRWNLMTRGSQQDGLSLAPLHQDGVEDDCIRIVLVSGSCPGALSRVLAANHDVHDGTRRLCAQRLVKRGKRLFPGDGVPFVREDSSVGRLEEVFRIDVHGGVRARNSSIVSW